MTYTEYLAIGAMVISVFGIWYGSRQARAAESSAKSAREAEKRAVKLERVMAFRWEIVTNGPDRYLLFNAGTRVAHDVRVVIPDFLSGVEVNVEKLQPLERVEFVVKVKPAYQSQVQVPLPRLVTVHWQDRDEKTPVNRSIRTTVSEYVLD